MQSWVRHITRYFFIFELIFRNMNFFMSILLLIASTFSLSILSPPLLQQILFVYLNDYFIPFLSFIDMLTPNPISRLRSKHIFFQNTGLKMYYIYIYIVYLGSKSLHKHIRLKTMDCFHFKSFMLRCSSILVLFFFFLCLGQNSEESTRY